MINKIFTFICFCIFVLFLVIYSRLAMWLVGLVLGFYWRAFLIGWSGEI